MTANTAPVSDVLTPLQRAVFETAAAGAIEHVGILACLSVDLDGRPMVALCSVTGEAGGQFILSPLWLAIDDELAARLRDPDGRVPEPNA